MRRTLAGLEPPARPPHGQAGGLRVHRRARPLLGGRFVRLDYTWSYQGTPQEGSLLVGFQSGPGRATIHWIDAWHMADGVLACEGAVEPDGTIAVRGSYAVPPGPDWGWRIAIRPGDGSALAIVMHNVTPGGEEAVAVEATFRRADP